MAKPPRPKRRKRALGCLLAAGFVVACLLGVGQAVRWWTGVVFPGTQFFYSSDSTQERVFRLTSSIGGKTVRIRIPKDYVSALFPGSYFGYDIIDLIAYLPDMVSEQAYDASDPMVTKSYPTIPKEQLLKRLDISLENSFLGPKDPTGNDVVRDQVDDFIKDSRPIRNNPYGQYNAYIWTPGGDDTIDPQITNSTYYVPKDGSPFYVSCMDQGGVHPLCSVLFVVDSRVYVDVTSHLKIFHKPKA